MSSRSFMEELLREFSNLIQYTDEESRIIMLKAADSKVLIKEIEGIQGQFIVIVLKGDIVLDRK